MLVVPLLIFPLAKKKKKKIKLCILTVVHSIPFVPSNYTSFFSYLILMVLVGGAFWFLSPKSRRIQVQRAQHNEFLESGLKTRFR